MLPRIHLGTLLTVADSQLTTQSKRQKQATLEARADRNLEGFYIYQTYLRRLRRMHRAYVRRYKQAHPETKIVPPPPRTSQFYSVYGSNSSSEGGFMPLRHRLALSDSDTTPRNVSVRFEDQPPLTTPPSSPVTSRSSITSEQSTIRIPCGRESSFHDLDSGSNASVSKSGNSKYFSSNSSGAYVKNGALPFRMWRQEQGKKGAASIYSYATIKEEAAETAHERKPKGDSRRLHPKLVGLPVKSVI